MSYPHNDPYQQDNAHGVIPSSLDNSNSNAVQAANLLAMIIEGIPVHTRFSQPFKVATIHW
jgi:hypothetical protein